MQTISDLLLKYKIPGVRHSEIRKICAEEVKELTGCVIEAKNVKYKDETLFLNVPSVLKSALVLQQNGLTTRLAARGVTIKKIS